MSDENVLNRTIFDDTCRNPDYTITKVLYQDEDVVLVVVEDEHKREYKVAIGLPVKKCQFINDEVSGFYYLS